MESAREQEGVFTGARRLRKFFLNWQALLAILFSLLCFSLGGEGSKNTRQVHAHMTQRQIAVYVEN